MLISIFRESRLSDQALSVGIKLLLVARFSRILRTRATIIAEAAKSPNNILVSGIIIREMIDARTHAQILRFIQSENIVIQAYHGSDLSRKKPWSIASTGQPGNRVPMVEVKSREVTLSECGFLRFSRMFRTHASPGNLRPWHGLAGPRESDSSRYGAAEGPGITGSKAVIILSSSILSKYVFVSTAYPAKRNFSATLNV